MPKGKEDVPVMKVSQHRIGDVTVLELDGGLGYDNYKNFKAEIEPYVSQPGKKLVIDLSKVTYLSSWGIGALLSLSSRVKKNGGRVVFANLHGEISEIIHIMRLNTIFHLFDSVEDAVKALSPEDSE